MGAELSTLFSFLIVGLVTGSAYAIAASGLVITYATSNVFNIAHGAIGMVMAFTFWHLGAQVGLPSWLSLVLVVFVIAPLFGALIERTMMRQLTDAPVTLSLTVTVGLMVGLIGLAQLIWPPGARRIDQFFAGSGVQLGDVFVTAHEMLTFGLAVVVAGGLYYLLKFTRTGIGMRAVVDNRVLLSLHGARPSMLGMLAWAIGASMAALGGILQAPIVQLDYLTLTLLVVNAYAAAMVGQLKNLPRTFIGALTLGVAQSYFLLLQSGQIPTWFVGLVLVVVFALAFAGKGQAKVLALSGLLILALAGNVPGAEEGGLGNLVVALIAMAGFLAMAARGLITWRLGGIAAGFVAATSLLSRVFGEGNVLADIGGGLSALPPEFSSGMRAAVPALFLFVVMLVLPQEKLRIGAVEGASLVRAPSWNKAFSWGAVAIAVTILLAVSFGTANTATLAGALAFATIMLSLVVLTGYGGDVSLGQMTFVGIGALTVARWLPAMTPFDPAVSILSIVAAGLVSAVVGAIVALPALRLRGLYLALGTLAFAGAMDKLLLENSLIGFNLGGASEVGRPGFLGLDTETGFTIFAGIAFVGMSLFVLWLRKGRWGRFLLATRDSQAACATLGLDITKTRVQVFAISAGMAGVAGAILAGVRVSVGSTDFIMFQSLPLLLLTVTGGITSVTGALLGGIFLSLRNAFSAGPAGLAAVGLLAILLARLPNGLAGLLFSTGKGTAPDAEGSSGETVTDADVVYGEDDLEEVSVVASA